MSNKTNYGEILKSISEMYEDFGYLDIYNKEGKKIDLATNREIILENMLDYLKNPKQDRIASKSIEEIIQSFSDFGRDAAWELHWREDAMNKALDRNLTGYKRISTKESWYEILSRPKGWKEQEIIKQQEEIIEENLSPLVEKLSEYLKKPLMNFIWDYCDIDDKAKNNGYGLEYDACQVLGINDSGDLENKTAKELVGMANKLRNTNNIKASVEAKDFIQEKLNDIFGVK